MNKYISTVPDTWEHNTIVLCQGCFDILHIGHVLHLEAAKKLGNKLVVAITPDKYIKKGPGRPRFDEKQRMAMLAALAREILILWRP